MPTLIVLKKIIIIVISIAVGFAYFYLMSDKDHQVKKQQLDDFLSLLINFVIYIWIGKILFHFQLFIKDPIAVLAYPSHSNAFYIATALLSVNIAYINMKKGKNITVIHLTRLLIPIFLTAIFTYEVIQFTVNGLRHNGVLLLFITVLLILFTFKKEKSKQFIFLYSVIILIGLSIISFTTPLMTVFGYMLAPWYFLLLCLLLVIWSYRYKGMV